MQENLDYAIERMNLDLFPELLIYSGLIAYHLNKYWKLLILRTHTRAEALEPCLHENIGNTCTAILFVYIIVNVCKQSLLLVGDGQLLSDVKIPLGQRFQVISMYDSWDTENLYYN